MRKLVIVSVLAILIMSVFVPSVEAASLKRVQLDYQNEFSDFVPGIENVNMDNYDSALEFRDAVKDKNGAGKGLYWGNLLPCYKVNYPYTGRIIFWNSTFNFTTQSIQFGSNGYWVRIPLDASKLDRLVILPVANDPINQWLSPVDPILDISNFDDNNNIFYDENWIYARIYQTLLPGEQDFTFIGYCKSWASATVQIANEQYTSNDDTIILYEYHEEIIRSGTQLVIDSWEEINLDPVNPAVAFLFQAALDTYGFGSRTITKYEEITQGFSVSRADGEGRNISLYFPFISKTPVNFGITFYATLGGPAYAALVNPLTGNSTTSVKIWVNDTTEYVLVSCPYYLNYSGGGFLFDSASCGVRISTEFYTIASYLSFPGYSILTTEGTGSDLFSVEYTYNYTGTTNTVYREDRMFMEIELTDGYWTKVTSYGIYSIIDFGWGTGQKYPGTSEIVIFLDNGGEIFYSGGVEEIWRSIRAGYNLPPSNLEVLAAKIRFLADSMIRPYVETLQGFLDNLITFARFIWRILEGTYNYFISIGKLMLYVIPVVGIEFTAAMFTDQFKGTNRAMAGVKRIKRAAKKPVKRVQESYVKFKMPKLEEKP